MEQNWWVPDLGLKTATALAVRAQAHDYGWAMQQKLERLLEKAGKKETLATLKYHLTDGQVVDIRIGGQFPGGWAEMILDTAGIPLMVSDGAPDEADAAPLQLAQEAIAAQDNLTLSQFLAAASGARN